MFLGRNEITSRIRLMAGSIHRRASPRVRAKRVRGGADARFTEADQPKQGSKGCNPLARVGAWQGRAGPPLPGVGRGEQPLQY